MLTMLAWRLAQVTNWHYHCSWSSSCLLIFSSITVHSMFSLLVSLTPGYAALLMAHSISFHPGLLQLSSKAMCEQGKLSTQLDHENSRHSSPHLLCKGSFLPLFIEIAKGDYSCIWSVDTVVALSSLETFVVTCRRNPFLRTKDPEV